MATEGGRKMMFVGITIFLFLFLAFGERITADEQVKDQGHHGPMVAFVCQLPAMHWTPDGWMADETTGCLKDKADIIAYCQKMYGHLSVVDAIESIHRTQISSWEGNGLKTINNNSHFVKPFRCIVSESLSVSSASPTDNVQEASAVNAAMIKNSDEDDDDDDAYLHFIRNAPQTNLTEHEYYTKARSALKRRQRLKMSKMIEQWKRMNRTTERRANADQQSSEDIQKQITRRFQKLYEALVEEEKYEAHQLSDLHQQRVQAELNQLKRDALDSFMKAIRSEPTENALIMKTLKNYIRAEERDSEHTVTRFIHIRRKDPREAETIASYVIEHLKVIDKRIRQAVDMLDRIPKHKKSILRMIEPFLRQFDSLDESIASVTSAIMNMNTSSSANDVIAGTDDDDVTTNNRSTTSDPMILLESQNGESPAVNEIEKEKKKEKGTRTNQMYQQEISSSNDDVTGAPPDAMTTVGMTTPGSTKTREAGPTVRSSADAGVKDKYGVMHKVKLDHVAFMQKNEYHLKEMNIDVKDSKSIKEPTSFLATPIGMTLFSIALVMLIAAALILLHRKVRSATPVTVGSGSGGAQSRTPRFLASRKQSTKWSKGGGGGGGGLSNGYENPTYRYLNSAAKA